MISQEFKSCYQKALSLLARRAYSSHKLKDKLKKFFSEPTITQCLEKLIELRYIDDEQYLKRQWEKTKHQGVGALARQRKLLQEGFDKETLKKHQQLHDQPEADLDQVLEYLQRRKSLWLKNLHNPESKIKIWRHLAYKGHSFKNIEQIWKKLTATNK